VNQIHAVLLKIPAGLAWKVVLPSCPCKKVVKVDEPFIVDPEYGGPEYETLALLGRLRRHYLKSILKGNERCNAYSWIRFPAVLLLLLHGVFEKDI